MEQACMTVKDSALRVYVLQIMPNIKTMAITVDKGFIPTLQTALAWLSHAIPLQKPRPGPTEG